MADLQNPIFNDESAARAALEALVWPTGPVCPHCGATDRQAKVEGTKKSHRPGLHYCNHCQGTYTATVGTVFERSKVSLSKWWMACHLMSSSKKGVSAHQLHRMLGVTYKTAWFMAHRIREAMTVMNPGPIGGEGKTIESDEMYYGPTERMPGTRKGRQGTGGKHKVVALVERGGPVRSFHVEKIDYPTVSRILLGNASPESHLMTDAAGPPGAGAKFASHQTVKHTAGEYVRGNVHTNTIEGYFGLFQRGMRGIYQHCEPQHLQRYLTEFDFRYSHRKITDAERTDKLVMGIRRKRLTYRRTNEAGALR